MSNVFTIRYRSKQYWNNLPETISVSIRRLQPLFRSRLFGRLDIALIRSTFLEMLVPACNRVVLFRLCIFRAYRRDWPRVTDTRKAPTFTIVVILLHFCLCLRPSRWRIKAVGKATNLSTHYVTTFQPDEAWSVPFRLRRPPPGQFDRSSLRI